MMIRQLTIYCVYIYILSCLFDPSAYVSFFKGGGSNTNQVGLCHLLAQLSDGLHCADGLLDHVALCAKVGTLCDVGDW